MPLAYDQVLGRSLKDLKEDVREDLKESKKSVIGNWGEKIMYAEEIMLCMWSHYVTVETLFFAIT